MARIPDDRYIQIACGSVFRDFVEYHTRRLIYECSEDTIQIDPGKVYITSEAVAETIAEEKGHRSGAAVLPRLCEPRRHPQAGRHLRTALAIDQVS